MSFMDLTPDRIPSNWVPASEKPESFTLVEGTDVHVLGDEIDFYGDHRIQSLPTLDWLTQSIADHVLPLIQKDFEDFCLEVANFPGGPDMHDIDHARKQQKIRSKHRFNRAQQRKEIQRKTKEQRKR